MNDLLGIKTVTVLLIHGIDDTISGEDMPDIDEREIRCYNQLIHRRWDVVIQERKSSIIDGIETFRDLRMREGIYSLDYLQSRGLHTEK